MLWPFPPAVYDPFLGLTTAYDEGAARAVIAQPADGSEPERFTGPGVLIEPKAPKIAEWRRYDPCGNLTEHRDPDGSVYRYAYTSWNLTEKEIDPLGNTTTYSYSPYAWTTHVTDPGYTENGYVTTRKTGSSRFDYSDEPRSNMFTTRPRASSRGRTAKAGPW